LGFFDRFFLSPLMATYVLGFQGQCRVPAAEEFALARNRDGRVSRGGLMPTATLRGLFCFLARAVLAFAVAIPAQADTLYNTFGPGVGYLSGSESAYLVGGGASGTSVNQVVAEEFTLGGSFTFTDALAAVLFAPGATNLRGMVYPLGATVPEAFLETDSHGLPGAILDTLSPVGTVSAPDGFFTTNVVTYNCSACPTLSAGENYWLVLFQPDPNTATGWDLTSSSIAANGNQAFNIGNIGTPTGPWAPDTANTVAAFQIQGTPAHTPEPNTLLISGSGLSVALLLWKSRAQK